MIAEVRGAQGVRRLSRQAGGRSRRARATRIVALSQLAADPAVAEAEINPLIVLPAGQGVVAVDALVRLA